MGLRRKIISSWLVLFILACLMSCYRFVYAQSGVESTRVYDLNTAVSCMKNGAFDYLVKPIDVELLLSTIKRALERSEQIMEVDLLKKAILVNNIEIRIHNPWMTSITCCGSSMTLWW